MICKIYLLFQVVILCFYMGLKYIKTEDVGIFFASIGDVLKSDSIGSEISTTMEEYIE